MVWHTILESEMGKFYPLVLLVAVASTQKNLGVYELFKDIVLYGENRQCSVMLAHDYISLPSKATEFIKILYNIVPSVLVYGLNDSEPEHYGPTVFVSRYSNHCMLNFVTSKKNTFETLMDRMLEFRFRIRRNTDYYVLWCRKGPTRYFLEIASKLGIKFKVGVTRGLISDRIVMLEAHCPHCNEGYGRFLYINTYEIGRGFVNNSKDLFPDFYYNFRRRLMTIGSTNTLNMTLYEWIPIENYEVTCDIEIIRIMSQQLNFTWETRIPRSGFFGVQTNNTWDGLIGELLAGDIEFAIPASISERRYRDVEFTTPYGMEVLVLVTTKPERRFAWTAVIRPFTWSLWLLLIGCLIVLGFAFHSIAVYSRFLVQKAEFGQYVTPFFNRFRHVQLGIVKSESCQTERFQSRPLHAGVVFKPQIQSGSVKYESDQSRPIKIAVRSSKQDVTVNHAGTLLRNSYNQSRRVQDPTTTKYASSGTIPVAMVMEQSVNIPTMSDPSRVFLSVWLCCCIVICCGYKSRLTTFLTIPIIDTPPASFEDLLRLSYPFGTYPPYKRPLQSLFSESLREEYQLVGQEMQLEDNVTTCLTRALQERFACITFLEAAQAEILVNFTDQYGYMLFHMEKLPYMESLAIVIRKKTPFRRAFDSILRNVVQSGMLDRCYSQKHEEARRKGRRRISSVEVLVLPNAPTPLHLKQLDGAYVLLAVGFGFGLVAFALEFKAAANDQFKSVLIMK